MTCEVVFTDELLVGGNKISESVEMITGFAASENYINVIGLVY